MQLPIESSIKLGNISATGEYNNNCKKYSREKYRQLTAAAAMFSQPGKNAIDTTFSHKRDPLSFMAI